MTEFNPARLNLARRRRGLTKSALAEEASISLRMLTAYERDGSQPTPDTLNRLATALAFPIEFFVGSDLEEPPEDGTSFRALSRLTARQRDQALGSGAMAIQFSDWIERQFVLPEPAVPQFQGLDPETAAAAVRTEWGLGDRPIKNMIHLLESRGVRVFSLAEECVEVDAYSFWRGETPFVFLNTMKSGERSRMDAAHELGHLVLHWKGGAHGRDAEHQADLFGSAFLMAPGSVIATAPRGGRLAHLIQTKQYWKVSVAGLAYRMHALGLLTDWEYRTLFIEISRKGYRTNEPDGCDHETSQVLAKVFKTLRDDGQSLADVANELGIYSDELNRIVFGLVLTPIPGRGRTRGEHTERPPLRLV